MRLEKKLKNMYKIYTSYFSNKRLKNKEGIKIPVCLSLQNCTGGPFNRWYKELAPSLEIFKKYKSVGNKTKSIKNWFTREYLRKLNELKNSYKLEGYIDELRELVQYNDVFLLCYERPAEFCHRHVLAEYLNNNYELNIEEY